MGYFLLYLLSIALFFIIGFLVGTASDKGSLADIIQDYFDAIDLIEDRRKGKDGKHDV